MEFDIRPFAITFSNINGQIGQTAISMKEIYGYILAFLPEATRLDGSVRKNIDLNYYSFEHYIQVSGEYFGYYDVNPQLVRNHVVLDFEWIFTDPETQNKYEFIYKCQIPLNQYGNRYGHVLIKSYYLINGINTKYNEVDCLFLSRRRLVEPSETTIMQYDDPRNIDRKMVYKGQDLKVMEENTQRYHLELRAGSEEGIAYHMDLTQKRFHITV